MRKASEVLAGKPLTEREIEYLRLVAEGLPNKEVASRIGTSEKTAKNMVSSILAKLDARSRTHAVVIALRTNILTLRELKAAA
jgi:DNA-binding NarL/FixJ family response regulator